METKDFKKRLIENYMKNKEWGNRRPIDLTEVASDPDTPKKILEYICDYDDLRVNCALLKNPNLTADLRKKVEARRKLIEEDILSRKRNYELLLLIMDPNTSADTLSKLFEDREKVIDIITNYDIIVIDYESIRFSENLREFSDKKMKELRDRNSMFFFYHVFLNPNVSKEILEEIAKNVVFFDYEIDNSNRYDQIAFARAIYANKNLSMELKQKAKEYLERQLGKENDLTGKNSQGASKTIHMKKLAYLALQNGVTSEDVARVQEKENLGKNESGDIINDEKH